MDMHIHTERHFWKKVMNNVEMCNLKKRQSRSAGRMRGLHCGGRTFLAIPEKADPL